MLSVRAKSLVVTGGLIKKHQDRGARRGSLDMASLPKVQQRLRCQVVQQTATDRCDRPHAADMTGFY